MDQLTATFLVAGIVAAGILIWMHTPAGKRWHKSLYPDD